MEHDQPHIGDITDPEERKAALKLSKIVNFDAKSPVDCPVPCEIQSKEIEDYKQELDNLKRETCILTTKIIELKNEKDSLKKNLGEKEMRLNSLEKEVEENEINREREMKEFRDNHTNTMKELEDEFTRKIEEVEQSYKLKVTEINEINKRLNEKLRKNENQNMKSEPKESEEIADKTQYYQSYLGQVCFMLQAMMYYFVLPDHFAEDCSYRVKDIEEDIDDEDMLDTEERRKAKERWDELKKGIQWGPSLVGTLKILQKERDFMDPPDLNYEEATKAAKELNEQGRLRGRTSYKRVQKIIEMWRTVSELRSR